MTALGERKASVIDETAWFLDRLFSGMQLDEALQRRLRAIIADYIVRARVVGPPRPGVSHMWDQALALHTERDRELEALLNADQRVRFAINATAGREIFATLRRFAR